MCLLPTPSDIDQDLRNRRLGAENVPKIHDLAKTENLDFSDAPLPVDYYGHTQE